MKKVGRNKPCPCGSGKKYKKCHGASNVIEISPIRYNSELEQLHSGLIEFTINKYETRLGEVVQKYIQSPMLEDQELMNRYMTGLSAWAILNEPIQNGQTIFEIYAENQQMKIKNERVRSTFALWANVVPSTYEVLSITEENLTLKDVRTKETYTLSGYKGTNLEVGSMVIGILLPYVQKHAFFLSFIELFDVNKEMIHMMETLSDDELAKAYPDILARTMMIKEQPSIELAWDNPLYEMVADVFAKHAHDKDTDENIISVGLALWKLFTEKENPTFKKPQAYAAAIDYMIQQVVLKDSLQSQKELAEEYSTSPTTVSKHFRKMTEVLDTELEKVVAEMKDQTKAEVIEG